MDPRVDLDLRSGRSWVDLDLRSGCRPILQDVKDNDLSQPLVIIPHNPNVCQVFLVGGGGGGGYDGGGGGGAGGVIYNSSYPVVEV